MRHLIILLMTLSLGALVQDPLAASFSAAPSTHCSQPSDATSHHHRSHHRQEQAAVTCCAGACFVVAVVEAFMLASTPTVHATEPAADSHGCPRDIEPADPPPRA